ncbi:MAG TPA: aminoglycoside phosphotransferase family protein [Acidimicrobiales bacterium]|nr:aminoglycoside phosphotransferase family protein [Acidimicrobiales bacterium]
MQALLHEQHPDLSGLALARQADGWDNVLWRLGDDLLVRLPRRPPAATLVAHEQRWLPELAPRLPLAVPLPVRTGLPGCGFPWPWSVVPWLAGEPATLAPMNAPLIARQLGGFLRALHVEAPAGAPYNTYRSVPLAARAPDLEARLTRIGLRPVWEDALAADPHGGPPLWVHGDLHPANVLVAGRALAGVIDFGDMCAGDPAVDLAAMWMLLPPSAHDRFAAAYGPIDDHLRRRARGWAVVFGTLLVAIGSDPRPASGRPLYLAAGRRTLARLTRPSR